MTEERKLTPKRLAEIDDFIAAVDERTSLRAGPTPVKDALHDLRNHTKAVEEEYLREREQWEMAQGDWEAENVWLREWLEGIRDFEPHDEVAFDEFAYKRLLEAIRDAASSALEG